MECSSFPLLPYDDLKIKHVLFLRCGWCCVQVDERRHFGFLTWKWTPGLPPPLSVQPMGERPVFIWKTDSLSFSIRQKTLNSITHKHDKSGNKTEGRITKAVLPVPPQDKNKTRLSGISQGKTQRWRAWSVLLADSVYLKEGSKAKKSLPLGGLTVWFCVASIMVSQNRKFWTFFEIEIGWLIT